MHKIFRTSMCWIISKINSKSTALSGKLHTSYVVMLFLCLIPLTFALGEKNPLKPVEVWMLKRDPRLQTRWGLCPKDNCTTKNQRTEEKRQQFVLTSRIFLSLHYSDLGLEKCYEVLNWKALWDYKKQLRNTFKRKAFSRAN